MDMQNKPFMWPGTRIISYSIKEMSKLAESDNKTGLN